MGSPFSWHQYGNANGNAYIRRGANDPLVYFNWFDIGATHLGKAVYPRRHHHPLRRPQQRRHDQLRHLARLPRPAAATATPRPHQPSRLSRRTRFLPATNLRSHLVMHSRNNKRADFVDISDQRASATSTPSTSTGTKTKSPETTTSTPRHKTNTSSCAAQSST